MTEKEKKFVEAAISVLSKYGVRRTTMGEIAAQAGVSRQTLYASFPSKEEIMAAAMHYAIDKTLTEIKRDWQDADTIAKKLDIYFQHAVIAYYELIRNMPDASDLIAGTDAATIEERQRGEARKSEALAVLFSPYEEVLARSGMTGNDLADLIQNSSASFKYIATDRTHLDRLLASLKSAALSLIGEL